MDAFRETKPQLLFLLALLLAAVLFSLFQAISALSGSSGSPEYERVPPAAFAEVPYLTLFPENTASSNLEEGARLDDASYLELLDSSRELTDAIFEGSLREDDLIRLGMSVTQASETWLEVEPLVLILSEENLEDVRYNPMELRVEPSLTEDVSGIVASSESVVDFKLSSRSGTLRYDFVNDGDQGWKLSSLSID